MIAGALCPVRDARSAKTFIHGLRRQGLILKPEERDAGRRYPDLSLLQVSILVRGMDACDRYLGSEETTAACQRVMRDVEIDAA